MEITDPVRFMVGIFIFMVIYGSCQGMG